MKTAKVNFSYGNKSYNVGDAVPDDVAASFPHLMNAKEIKEVVLTEEEKKEKRIEEVTGIKGNKEVIENKAFKTVSTQKKK